MSSTNPKSCHSLTSNVINTFRDPIHCHLARVILSITQVAEHCLSLLVSRRSPRRYESIDMILIHEIASGHTRFSFPLKIRFAPISSVKIRKKTYWIKECVSCIEVASYILRVKITNFVYEHSEQSCSTLNQLMAAKIRKFRHLRKSKVLSF